VTGYDSKRAMAADKLHWSDCAVHNGPAYPAGPCDCGVAQPAQEPVAQGSKEHLKIMMEHSAWDDRLELSDALANIDDFYATTPPLPVQPERPWVGLTNEEIHGTAGYDETRETYQFALALIAKLKERNS